MNLIKLEPDNDLEYKYQITRVGSNIINKLIYEYRYLRIILDDVLVPERINNLLRIPAELTENNKMWNIANIQRICRFILLVDAVENHEKNVFSQRYDVNSFLNYYEISTKLKSEFMKTALRIIGTLEGMKMDQWVKAYGLIKNI